MIIGTEKKRAALANYRSMQAHLANMEKLALELMRHPTATDEHVLAARDTYRKTVPQVQAVKESLIKLGILRDY